MTPRDHSVDAGGDPEVLDRKRELREEVWDALSDAGATRFPGTHGRIPNFTGAERAAERLRGCAAWRGASALKANPDSPQWPVRQRALEDGIVVYMAVPRLADDHPFVVLDPTRLDVSARAASSIKGSGEHGRQSPVEDLEPVQLVITGCVAVDASGARLGKGGGFADLEYAVAAAAGLITDRTVIATTVHPLQVLDEGRIPMTDHDVPIDLIVTPDEVVTCDGRGRPAGIVWEELTEEKIDSIPLLRRLQGGRS